MIGWLIATGSWAYAQDSLLVDLPTVEHLFLERNLSLIAQKFQIKTDEALIEQAKVWDNPTFDVGAGMRSINHPKFLDIGRNGETTYAVDQIIRLAGKRNKNIALARLQSDYSQAVFEDLMRTLKIELRDRFYSIYFKTQTLSVLKKQEHILNEILIAYQQADKNGSVPRADLIRLQALQLNLSKGNLDLNSRILEDEQSLSALLGTSQPIKPVLNEAITYPFSIERYSVEELINKALSDRSDVKIGTVEQQTAKAGYALQKALAVPDMHVGLAYDQNGGYVKHSLGITVGIDLPLWDRNKGNIKAAQFKIERADVLQKQIQNIVTTEVATAYQNVLNYKQGYDRMKPQLLDESYRSLIENIARTFTKGNISILQFIDFFNSYSTEIGDLNDFYESFFHSYNQLEYAVGAPLNP